MYAVTDRGQTRDHNEDTFLVADLATGEPTDQNLYEMDEKKLAKIPHAPETLGDALDALEKDSSFLTEHGVFSQDFLDDFIAVKRAEVADERK